ncbi:hypothetical protein [Pseudomonas xantholysinigenes]|uniref:Uncharacterized protein n=1 Tax=Pseudomonas xantholysinigenes TaxID=2745490 RepID=A0A9E6TVQ7_9PSED|nr:hypothetical protein [Pseudomonas xantholysinigenes]QXI36712.1 hypothetical protein HU772_015270 [Pseudomonas xantholysinigenes]
MILSQRATTRAGDAPLIIQQVSLELEQDQQQITLRRYFEHYGPDSGDWVEYRHSVSIRELEHWLMAHGSLRIECPQGVVTAREAGVQS